MTTLELFGVRFEYAEDEDNNRVVVAMKGDLQLGLADENGDWQVKLPGAHRTTGTADEYRERHGGLPVGLSLLDIATLALQTELERALTREEES